jgi:hypothetical protein
MSNGTTAMKWPTVSGTVQVSDYRRGLRGKTLDLKVDYEVNGTHYSCSRVEYGRGPDSRDRFRYFQGAMVRVFHSPSDPSECVLEPGVSFAMMIELFLGLGLLALAQYAHQYLKLSSPSNELQQSLNEASSLDQVHELAANGKLIEAIKAYRTLTGKGLRESKDYVEEYLRSNGFTSQH